MKRIFQFCIVLEKHIKKAKKKIIGQIISLSKNIVLNKPSENVAYEHVFYAGRRKHSIVSSGFSVRWWYTETAKSNISNLTSLIIRQQENFSFDDEEVIIDLIFQMFNEICVDSNFFNFEFIITQKNNTLFECRSVDSINIYGENIYDELVRRLNMLSTKWLNCYTAPRISGSSLFIEAVGIYLIDRNDKKSWEQMVSKGYFFNGWNPEVDKFGMSYDQYSYVFCSENSGTNEGSLSKSIFDLRLLLSVVFSFIIEEMSTMLKKCAAQPYDVLVQYPLIYGNGKTVSMRSNYPLLPYYMDSYCLTETDLTALKAWYEKYINLNLIQMSKVSKCGYFINKGMNSDGIDSFINYFIALDALFGVRGDVENSIIKGIESLSIDSSWLDKIEYLYQLRNELVHGGSREFKEWNKYRKYFNHFKTTPRGCSIFCVTDSELTRFAC